MHSRLCVLLRRIAIPVFRHIDEDVRSDDAVPGNPRKNHSPGFPLSPSLLSSVLHRNVASHPSSCISCLQCRPRWALRRQPAGQPPPPPEPLRSYAVGDAVDVLVDSLHWEGVVAAVRHHPPETVTVYGTCARPICFSVFSLRLVAWVAAPYGHIRLLLCPSGRAAGREFLPPLRQGGWLLRVLYVLVPLLCSASKAVASCAPYDALEQTPRAPQSTAT